MEKRFARSYKEFYVESNYYGKSSQNSIERIYFGSDSFNIKMKVSVNSKIES